MGSTVCNAFLSVTGVCPMLRTNFYCSRFSELLRRVIDAGPARRRSLRGREMAKTVRCDQKSQEEERIVADVHQVAGDDRVRPGAGVGENDADYHQQRDLRPAP